VDAPRRARRQAGERAGDDAVERHRHAVRDEDPALQLDELEQ
jgi:hypothetical protein